MGNARIEDSVFWSLIHATVLTKPGVTQISEAYGLTPGQMYTLCRLQPGLAVPMQSVCRTLHCDPSNVTGIADRLVAGGLITRKESEQDRRIKTVMLTEKGEQLRTKLLQKIADFQFPELARLSPAEQATLQELLLKLTDGVDNK